MSAGIKKWVIVCTPLYFVVKDSGPVQPARMVFDEEGTLMRRERSPFKFFCVLSTVGFGRIWKDKIDHACRDEEMNNLLDTLLSRSGYTVWPGIQEYEKQI